MNKDNSTKKETTLDDLVRIMTDGFDKSGKETDKKIDDLALMVAKGFDGMNEKMDNGFKEIKLDIRDIKADLHKKVDKIDHNTLTYRVEKLEKNFA